MRNFIGTVIAGNEDEMKTNWFSYDQLGGVGRCVHSRIRYYRIKKYFLIKFNLLSKQTSLASHFVHNSLFVLIPCIHSAILGF